MATYLNKYFDRLINTLNSTDEELELEVRFRGYGRNIDLSWKEYTRVKEYLINLYGKVEPERTEDYIKNSKEGRIRQTLTQGPYGFSIKEITKNDLWRGFKDQIDRDFDFKIALSSEISREVKEAMIDKDITRIKNRHSWNDSKNFIRFDITRVSQTDEKGKTEDKYEVEMELIHPLLLSRPSKLTPENISELSKALSSLSKHIFIIRNIITDSDIVYNSRQRTELAEFINKTINARKYLSKNKYDVEEGSMVSDVAVKARNIKFKDLVYGGLLSKQWDSSQNDKITTNPSEMGYSVTPKAEGVRKFLIIYNSGIWLVYGSEFCRICVLPEGWRPYIGTILDGEDIRDVSKRIDYKNFIHFYTAFDTLAFKGEDKTKETLKQRQTYIKFLHSLGVVMFEGRYSLVMEEKPFLYFSGEPETFYRAMKQIQTVKVSYKTDGYIFTPNRCEYNPQTIKLIEQKRADRIEDRKLSKFPDILKWKPSDEMTIDLAYCITPEGRFLCFSQGNNLVKFTGSRHNKFDASKQVDWEHYMFNSLPEGTIVEFEPYMSLEKQYMLRPKLIRWDKQYANSRIVAEDVWDDIHNPIPLSTLLGNDLRLVRKLHNRIKSEILSKDIPKDSHLIDIGAGRGGDIDKMNKFSRILSIEPWKPYFDEFKRRLSKKSEDFQSRFHLLECGGEETDKITEKVKEVFGKDLGSKPLYISFMLSLSFFWKSKSFLFSLIQTINGIRRLYYESGGVEPIKIIFMTIEGDRAYKILQKYNFKIMKNGYRMSYDIESKEVSILIPETIVGKEGESQTEYLVKLEELSQDLGSDFDYIKGCDKFSNTPLLLSSDEMEYNSMYVYGSLSLNPLIEKRIKYEPPKSTSTLFDCLFKAINSKEEYTLEDVIYFRKTLSDSIINTNPFDLEGRSFYESSDNGILQRVSKTPQEAQEWIFSDMELPPEYITWIPDMIGYNLKINDVLYERMSNDTHPPTNDTINLTYNSHYKLL